MVSIVFALPPQPLPAPAAAYLHRRFPSLTGPSRKRLAAATFDYVSPPLTGAVCQHFPSPSLFLGGGRGEGRISFFIVFLARLEIDELSLTAINMNTIPEIKACENCAKAKRKCGKEVPGCHRCTSRGLPCVYPPARPTSFVRLQDDQTTPPAVFDIWDSNVLFTPVSNFDVPLSDCPAHTDLQLLLSNLQPPARTPTPPRKHLDCEWFLSPESWKGPESHPFAAAGPDHDGINNKPSLPHPISSLKHFLNKLHRRSQDWVTRGSNDFIHKELYTFRSPRCIQDAQTAFALYLAKSDDTEDAVFRTLHARATQLLQDEEKHKMRGSHDVFGHLARCQALLIYQVIGLLDGDIHLRGAAEERIEILKAWLEQLIKSTTTSSALCFGNTLPGESVGKKPPSTIDVANAFGLGIRDVLILDDDSDKSSMRTIQSPHSMVQQEAVWHAWLFAESLRRTWIAASGLQTSYLALRTGWAMCYRSMKLTAGQGMWEAPTSYAWEKRCMKGDVLFMEGWDMDLLFTTARPEDVDVFAKSCMEATWGAEMMERWADSAVV